MSFMPYVPPEQLMKDRSDFAHKGIARGKSVIGLEYADGIMLIAENPSATLHKISEIYDRIAFAGVGKYSEFEDLRISGVRLADLRGYSYGREDVRARDLANAYSQALSTIFTQQMKPYEIELLVAEVDEKHPFVQLEMLMPVLPLVRVPDAAEAIATAKRVEHGFAHTAVMYSRNIAHLHAMARTINTSIFVKNASNLAGLGYGGEGYTSFTIASPTGEGLTTVRNFTRERRCTLKEYFRIV